MKKGLFFGSLQARAQGFSTIEVLIAFALLVMSISIAAEIVFGGMLVSYGARAKNQALQLSAHALYTMMVARVASIEDASEVMTIASTTYTRRMELHADAPCAVSATSSVAWVEGALRPRNLSIRTTVYDVQKLLASGGDCETAADLGDWSRPAVLAQGTLPLGKPTAIDVLDGVIYMGGSVAPYLFISNARAVHAGDALSFVSFENNFSLPEHIVFLDVVQQRNTDGDMKTYVYAALNASQEQLHVIDVTDIRNPITIARRSLRNVSTTGSEPMGHRLVYSAPRVYVTTKYTAGPELHVFDVSDPNFPTELGSGFEVGATVNALAVQEQIIQGVRKRFLYTATSQLHSEVRVFDVTDVPEQGSVSEVLAATVDLPGSQNAQSIAMLGDMLYVGRASTPAGPDLYIFSATNPTAGLHELASQDINTGVMGLIAMRSRVFLLTSKVTKELQIWNYGSAFSTESLHAVLGAMVGGFDYERGRLYATGQGTSSVQIWVGE